MIIEKYIMHSPINTEPKGQGFLEYAMIIFLVAVVVIVIVYWLGPAIGNMYSNITTNITNLPQ
jgi:Flp pilus assembly pilin Flp